MSEEKKIAHYCVRRDEVLLTSRQLEHEFVRVNCSQLRLSKVGFIYEEFLSSS